MYEGTSRHETFSYSEYMGKRHRWIPLCAVVLAIGIVAATDNPIRRAFTYPMDRRATVTVLIRDRSGHPLSGCTAAILQEHAQGVATAAYSGADGKVTQSALLGSAELEVLCSPSMGNAADEARERRDVDITSSGQTIVVQMPTTITRASGAQ